MLHPFQEASCRRVPLDSGIGESAPGRALLSLLCGVNDWLESEPCVQGSQEGKRIYVLYRDLSFVVEDFWDSFGCLLAQVSRAWPGSVFGTARNQETVQLTAREKEGLCELVQQSLSGHPADVLETFCLQLDCADPEITSRLLELLGAMRWTTGVAAQTWESAAFLADQRVLLDPGERSFFCYAGLLSDGPRGDWLLSLDFSAKIALWTAYLRDRFEPLEFDWLAEQIAQGEAFNRMEWELALREAMERLHFRLVNEEKSFALFDAAGRRLYVGADYRRPAEWALVKILFPLNFA